MREINSKNHFGERTIRIFVKKNLKRFFKQTVREILGRGGIQLKQGSELSFSRYFLLKNVKHES